MELMKNQGSEVLLNSVIVKVAGPLGEMVTIQVRSETSERTLEASIRRNAFQGA